MLNIDATQLPRVLVCNGSVLMEASPASINTPIEDAQEGTAAHFIAASVLSGKFTDPLEWVDRQTPNGIYVTPDMGEHVATFTNFIQHRNAAIPGHIFYVEANIDFDIPNSEVVIRARSDAITYDPATWTLYIDDFKFGWRIIDPVENWTLIAYALGICRREGWQVARVVMTIHQPRPYHPDGKQRSWSISGEELAAFGITLAAKLSNLTNELRTSPHCHKCRALATCHAASMAAQNSIDAISIPFQDTITNDVLSFEIFNMRRAQDAIKDKLGAYEELAKHRIKTGEQVPSLAVEPTLGNRAYVKGITPETIALLTGKPIDEITTRKPITPAALERMGVSEETITAFTYRPPTGEKLVKFNPSKKAQKLFGQN
jgi:hypothetical protein